MRTGRCGETSAARAAATGDCLASSALPVSLAYRVGIGMVPTVAAPATPGTDNKPPEKRDCSNDTGRFRAVHAIRLGIEPFAEGKPFSSHRAGYSLGSTGPCRANLELDPVALLQSPEFEDFRRSRVREFLGG